MKESTPPVEGMLQIGRVLKPHGLGGEARVDITSDRPERVEAGAEFHVGTDEAPELLPGADPAGTTAVGIPGKTVVLQVAEVRRHQQRWLMKFSGVRSKEDVEKYKGQALWAEPLEDPGELWVHELIGCRVIDSDGVDRGEVVSVQDNPASHLLVLDTGPLVPVRFVVSGPTNGQVNIEAPEGLFDL